jgi:hypothetical protein
MTYTLSLDRMHLAAQYDHRHNDLIAGAPNYGLRPERRIEAHLLRSLGYPVRDGHDEWLAPPGGYDSWTAVAGNALRSDPQPTDEPADGAAVPRAKGPPSAGPAARYPG